MTQGDLLYAEMPMEGGNSLVLQAGVPAILTYSQQFTHLSSTIKTGLLKRQVCIYRFCRGTIRIIEIK